MRWWWLLLVPCVAGQPVLHAVVPNSPGVDGVAITSASAWDLTGHRITDGESTWAFPSDASLGAGEVAWLVTDAEAWAALDGPEARWLHHLRLANGADQVVLVGPDGVLDAMAYGGATVEGMVGSAPRPGANQVLVRDGDTDHAQDWIGPRILRLGHSALDRPTFQAERVTLYASPDSSHRVLMDLMAGAHTRLHLHVYQLLEPSLVDGLVAAAQRGVDVQVMVEDAPVGVDGEEQRAADHALRRILDAGGAAYRAGSGRYAYHHLKVLVADDVVAVQSENWVASGVPLDPSWGNRGWGAVVHDAHAADWFAAWMAQDRGAWDTTTARPTPQWVPRMAPPTGAYAPIDPGLAPNVLVTPFISPDHTADPAQDPVLQLIRNAQHRIDVQQLDVRLEASNSLGWSAPDGLSMALADAAGRGIAVRVQAAAPFHAEDTGNREALAWLAARGVAVGEMDRPGIQALHNKGLIVDDRFVVLGSMNGNHHSRSNNREAGLILDSPVAAAYFGALFESDWNPSHARDWGQMGRDLRAIPVSPWPILLALTAVVHLRRCSPPSP